MDTPRHRIFQRARERADLSVEQLWLRYLELGGLADLIELDGFLHALVPLDDLQQDMLAHALNEGLEDAYRAARVPYLRPTPDLSPASDALDLVQKLLGRPLGARVSRDEPSEPPD